MRRLFAFGQVIASAIPVPGARRLTDRSEASPSLSIFRDDSAGGKSEAPAGFSRDGDALRLTVLGIATYRCRARAITVAPCLSATPTDLSELPRGRRAARGAVDAGAAGAARRGRLHACRRAGARPSGTFGLRQIHAGRGPCRARGAGARR